MHDASDHARLLVVSVTAFGGMWNTLVPAFAVLVLDVVFGAVAIHYLNRASSSDVQ